MIKHVSIVLAYWCPHCVPLSLNNVRKMTEMIGVSFCILDIDLPEQLKEADKLVRNYGDWCEDYLIPQVFIEYDNGEVRHVFTGFSESVSVTSARWNALFSFIESGRGFERKEDKEKSKYKSLTSFVEKYLTFEGQCRRHCSESTFLVKLISSQDMFVVAYVCSRNFVSTVVYFDKETNNKEFKNLLESWLGKGVVRSRDLRVAIRYGWELDGDAFSEISNVSPERRIKEIYWTNYPRAEAEKSQGVFLCQNYNLKKDCKRLFLQEINSKNRLCQKCR